MVSQKLILCLVIIVIAAAPVQTDWKGVASDWNFGHKAEMLNRLDYDWWYNWGFMGSNDGFAVNDKFVPMVWGKGAEQADLASVAREHPGKVWLIFNKPDQLRQANMTPLAGAAEYNRIYDVLKGADPTAQLLCCGEAWARHEWLEQFLSFVARPLDGVHVHGYSLDNDVGTAIANLEGFYNWVQTRPELVGKPIWITEIGVLSWNMTAEKSNEQFMVPLLDWYFRNTHKFQRIAWFADRSFMPGTNLTNEDGTLTPLGTTWNEARR